MVFVVPSAWQTQSATNLNYPRTIVHIWQLFQGFVTMVAVQFFFLSLLLPVICSPWNWSDLCLPPPIVMCSSTRINDMASAWKGSAAVSVVYAALMRFPSLSKRAKPVPTLFFWSQEESTCTTGIPGSNCTSSCNWHLGFFMQKFLHFLLSRDTKVHCKSVAYLIHLEFLYLWNIMGDHQHSTPSHIYK